MKISIITVCFNSEKTIERTIRSVLEQTYPNIEYIVVDGQSTDGTIDIINRYMGRVAKVISEKDQGIYDALNKGINMATGDVVGILHADDTFAHDRVLQLVADTFTKQQAEALYADLNYVQNDASGKVVRLWKSGLYSDFSFLHGWMPPHPTFFIKRKYFDQYGGYNLALVSASDYEFMLRMLYRYKVPAAYLKEVTVHMRVGGMSNQSIWNRLRANKEDRLAWKLNGLTPLPYTLFLKPIRKLPQYLKGYVYNLFNKSR